MTRYSGTVGFGFTEESPSGSGNWVTRVEEKVMKGDVGRSSSRLSGSESVNPDISLSNSISIVASTYALANYQAIRYLTWRGVPWSVTDVAIEGHRLVCNLGEVYDGPTPTESP